MRGVFFDLARQDADLAEPFLDERRPFADGMFLVPQGECVPALGEQMDLGRNAGAAIEQTAVSAEGMKSLGQIGGDMSGIEEGKGANQHARLLSRVERAEG